MKFSCAFIDHINDDMMTSLMYISLLLTAQTIQEAIEEGGDRTYHAKSKCKLVMYYFLQQYCFTLIVRMLGCTFDYKVSATPTRNNTALLAE